MVYLLVSIISALAMAVSVYADTMSFYLAFAAYSLTGTLVLTSVLVSAALNMRDETHSDDAAD